jgi:hypothetical protein
MMREIAQEVRELTVGLAEDSRSTIMAGDELDFADSGEHLRRGMAICRRLGLPLHDSLPGDEIGNEAHLLGHSKESGMAPNVGYEFLLELGFRWFLQR